MFYLQAAAGKDAGEQWLLDPRCPMDGGTLLGEHLALHPEDAGRGDGKLPFTVCRKAVLQRQTATVHPTDALAKAAGADHGVEKLWWLTKTSSTACLYLGLNREVTPQELQSAVENGDLDALMQPACAHAGNAAFIPAGMLHAAGAGVTLLEIKTTTSMTPDVYACARGDAKRAREIAAFATKRLSLCLPPNSGRAARLFDAETETVVDCASFAGIRIKLDGNMPLYVPPTTFFFLTVLEGQINVSGTAQSLKTDDCAFFPAGEHAVLEGKGTLLLFYRSRY